MVDRITSRMGNVVRPGVFVSQSGLGGSQPLSNHAIGYLYATVNEGYDNLRYSALQPYVPTQIFSLKDFVEQSGGVPSKGGSRISYDAVNSFFQNVGNTGILYVTRVVPTPETILTVDSSAGFGYNYFALKINGQYLGDIPIDQVDEDFDEIFVIRTTGIDDLDNALDLHRYLDGNKEFNYSFQTEQDEADIEPRRFRIFSKDPRVAVEVQQFKAYRSISPLDSEIDLLPYIRNYAPSKDLVVKLKSRDLVGGKEITHINGDSLLAYKQLLDVEIGTPLVVNELAGDAGDFDTLIKGYIKNVLGINTAVVGRRFAVERPSVEADLKSTFCGYARIDSLGVGSSLVEDSTISVGNDIGFSQVSSVLRQGYVPDSVQILYLEVAGENRVVVLNGNGVKELGDDLVKVIQDIFREKNLLDYYDITNVSAVSPNESQYLPNNGYSLTSKSLVDHGYPTVKPSLDGNLKLTGTVSSSGNVLTGVGTSFTDDLWVGAMVFMGTRKYTVTAIASDTSLTLSKAPPTPVSGSDIYLDRSEANGFYSHDYVLRIQITSKNGAKPPVFPGLDRNGLVEDSVVYLPSYKEEYNFSSYKYSIRAKAQDFVYAIINSLERKTDTQPGIIFAPEAFATITEGIDLTTKTQARDLRLRVSAAIATAAEGRIGPDGVSPSQHIGLIDCGGDIKNLQEARDELVNLRSKVGSAFGHLSFYAPYVINGVGNEVPLSAYVAGVACSRYINEGFQQAPAGARYPLRDATGLKFNISSQQQEVTYGLGLNPARELPNRGIVIWGARTISSNPLFKYVSTRSILNILLDVLNRSFDDLLFEQIDSPSAMFSRVRGIAITILQQFYNRGALFGDKPEQAYKVICDYTNNTNESMEAGSMACDLFVATSPTLERLFISVVRTPAGQVAMINERYDRTLNNIQNFQSIQNFR